VCCLAQPNNTICANFCREADYKFCGAFSKATIFYLLLLPYKSKFEFSSEEKAPRSRGAIMSLI
jgi:hypothetical protein